MKRIKDRLRHYKRLFKQDFGCDDVVAIAFIIYLLVLVCFSLDHVLLCSLTGFAIGIIVYLLRR